jgi:hypothetical protein
MNDIKPDRGKDTPMELKPAAGLRFRIWLACLGGALVGAGGVWWVIATRLGPITTDLASFVSWLAAVGGMAVLVGVALAFWLDLGLLAHVRGLTRAVASRQVALLRGLPASSGWGELSQLTQQLQQVLARSRDAERVAEELGLTRDQLAAVREALEQWAESERWSELRAETGPAAAVVEALNRGLRRLDDVREQNLEAARQIGAELERALESARGSAEQAERGFVEATALLTTVRELQRLGQELGQAVSQPGDARTTDPRRGLAVAAREAIEELVAASSESVDHLASGMAKVEEIAAQVPILANRATLIALNSTLGERVASESDVAEETRRLVIDIRTAVDRTSQLARELTSEVAAASARMRGARELVASKLEAMDRRENAPTNAVQDVARLLERIREMVQDATRKGERLSATGERASRSAEGLLRVLETESRELAGLVARLSPLTASEPPSPGAKSPGLRLLGDEEAQGSRRDERRQPESGEERR